MSKRISSTDLLIQLVMQQSRERLRKCALNNFQCPQIPPSENTDNKNATRTEVVAKDDTLGVVYSEGEALFSCIAEKEKSLNNCSSCCPQDFHYCARRIVFLKIGFIDDDIPPCFSKEGA